MTERKSVEELYPGTHPLTDAQVGDDLGTMDFVLSSDTAERNAWANDDYNPWYMDGSPFGGRLASPVLLASFDAKLFYGYYSYPADGSLFAKQEFSYLKPVFLDTPYVLSGSLERIYERKGRTFYRVAEVVRDAGGAEVMHMWKTIASPVTPRPTGSEDEA